MNIGRSFSVSDPGEVEPYAFDFVYDMVPGDSIVGSAWTCTVAANSQVADPNPSARLSGGPWNFSPTGTVQLVQGGVAGATYLLNAVVKTSFGYTISDWAYAPVEDVA